MVGIFLSFNFIMCDFFIDLNFSAKIHYGTSLSNVDYLHGGAESLLTITNLFIVLGLRQALRESESEPNATESQSKEASEDSN